MLHGECVVILNGEERPLWQWDFLHCPAETEHVFAGSADGPCAVLMIGSRREVAAHYPVNEVAGKYDASVTKATDEPAEASPTGGESRVARHETRGRSSDRDDRALAHELAATTALAPKEPSCWNAAARRASVSWPFGLRPARDEAQASRLTPPSLRKSRRAVSAWWRAFDQTSPDGISFDSDGPRAAGRANRAWHLDVARAAGCRQGVLPRPREQPTTAGDWPHVGHPQPVTCRRDVRGHRC